MENCKPTIVPLPLGTSLSDEIGTLDFDQTMYYHIIGQLLYLTNTRPNLSYVVGNVSQFMAHPQVSHWNAVFHILRYLQGTQTYGINYSRLSSPVLLQGFSCTSPSLQFEGYTDIDWAACKSSH